MTTYLSCPEHGRVYELVPEQRGPGVFENTLRPANGGDLPPGDHSTCTVPECGKPLVRER